MKKIFTIISILALSVLSGHLYSVNKALERKISQFERSLKVKPSLYVSLSPAVIDSVSSDGNVYAIEQHAGEVGSSGDYSFPVTFEPTNESKLWAEKPYLIPEKAYVIDVSFNIDTVSYWYKIITDESW